MHELPMAQEILEIVLEHAARAGATRVTDIHMVLGELSGVVDECIGFYWDLLSADTPAAGARLHFRRTPFLLQCLECGLEFTPDGAGFACVHCRSGSVRVSGGDEFRVEAIDVDAAPGEPAARAQAAEERT